MLFFELFPAVFMIVSAVIVLRLVVVDWQARREQDAEERGPGET